VLCRKMASLALARIIAGCYEEMIVCYDVIQVEDETEDIEGLTHEENGQSEKAEHIETPVAPKKLKLKLSFTDHPHSGSVRCIAASKGGMVASGSNDETIHVYNANTGRDVGSLMSHGGSVISLQFHGAKYLISGSEDNNVVVWKTKPKYEVLKTLRGHKGPVESVAMHPSGKIALSTGKDRTLKTWNLIKGRSAYVTNIKQEGSLVRWSPSGKYYAVIVGASGLRVYDVSTAGVVFSLDHRRRINALRFLNGADDDDLLLFGGEGKEMNLASVKEGKITASFDVHETRIRDIVEVEKPDAPPTAPGSRWIATGSNDGWIKLWELNYSLETPPSCHLICEVNSGVRISCLCSFTKRRNVPEGGKGKSKDEKMGEEEEDMETEEKEQKLKRGTTESVTDVNGSGKLERTPGKKVKFS